MPAVAVSEAFQTPYVAADNLDSPAVWHGPGGEHWVLSTAKATDVIVVHDAVSGAELRRIGGGGRGAGQFGRPNGIAVVDSLLLVVERDGQRVQVLALPSFTPLGTFGEGVLGKPYGISVVESLPGRYRVFVTDNVGNLFGAIPLGGGRDERVKVFSFAVEGGRVVAAQEATFGEARGPGAIRIAESVLADPAHGRLLLAEERTPGSHVKQYTLDGAYVGTAIGRPFFANEAEGLALYACGDGSGYVLATDQSSTHSTFHVFDRATLAHVGSFYGPHTAYTDGVALTQRAFGPFPSGAFYAVDEDGGVSAFDWGAIARALGLRTDCTER